MRDGKAEIKARRTAECFDKLSTNGGQQFPRTHRESLLRFSKEVIPAFR
jgi:hypothetical protein